MQIYSELLNKARKKHFCVRTRMPLCIVIALITSELMCFGEIVHLINMFSNIFRTRGELKNTSINPPFITKNPQIHEKDFLFL